MNERAGIKRMYLPLALGALSAVLYGTGFLAPAFLLPIQAAGARKGYRAMLVAAATAAGVASAWQLALLARSEAFGLSMALMGVMAPVSMMAALALMAMPSLKRVPFAMRALGAALASSMASLPTFALAAKDPGVREVFNAAAVRASQLLGTEGPDPDALWSAMAGAMASSFAAVIFLFLFASAWSGTRFGLRRGEAAETRFSDKDEPSLPPPLSEYRVPPSLVWILLLSWAAILFTRFVPIPVAEAIGWNAAIALSICYGVQGLAVAVALAGRIGMATAVRAIGPIALVLLLVSGAAGLWAIGVLALLGTLETWIPFRSIPKGEEP